MSAGRVQIQITTQNNSVSRCHQCRCTIVRENVPWNREWRCNGEHRRCTMIGCIPIGPFSTPAPDQALAVRADGTFQGSPAPEGW